MRRAFPIMVLGLIAVQASAVGDVRITGRVLNAGFPGRGIDCYRTGMWCPATVSLQNVGDEHVTARMVLNQRDKDGDVMVAESLQTLTAGADARRYRLDYVATRPGMAGVFSVSLYDEDGRLLLVYDDAGNPHESLPGPPSSEVGDEVTMVLDLSSRPLSSLDAFADDSTDLLKRPLTVVRLRPQDLPDRWYSLQALQAIIWDAPEVKRLSAAQAQALVGYVRSGGILVVAAGRSADDLPPSALGPILPVDVKGTRSVDVLSKVWGGLLKPSGWGAEAPMYRPAITVSRARARHWAVATHSQDDLGVDMVTRGRYGSGVVIFIATPLRDLFQEGGDKRRFYKEVLGLLSRPQAVKGRPWTHHADLNGVLGEVIGFRTIGKSYLVFVVLFVGAYIFAATIVVYGWLRRQSRLQHSWTVFAAVGVVGSVLGVGAAQALRGVGTDLRQMSVVDVVVPAKPTGPLEAQASAYFGVKTGTHTRLDLRLAPPENGEGADEPRSYLHPLPSREAMGSRSFVAPEPYRLRAGLAMMEAVPVRATLKRLQGYWFGRLDGGFQAMIAADSRGRLSSRSWVRNDLGMDLEECWLILSTARQMGGMPRDQRIFAYQIGPRLEDGAGPIQIGSIQPEGRADWPRLQDWHRRWAARFASIRMPKWGTEEFKARFNMDPLRTGLMLFTTLNEYDKYFLADQGIVEVEHAHSLCLDRCHLLTRETAMVIGFADVPGPVGLQVRPAGAGTEAWRSLEPEPGRSRTMFRFLVPVRHTVG